MITENVKSKEYIHTNLRDQLTKFVNSERRQTTLEQTKTLLSWGFPHPSGICLSQDNDLMIESRYDVFELLMFLTPYNINRHPEYGYTFEVDCEPVIKVHNDSLVDGLFECIKQLKEHGQYDEPEFDIEDITL